MSSADSLNEKIRDKRLCQLATETEGEPVTVLIEPSLAPTQVEFEVRLGQAVPSRRFIEMSPEAIQADERKIEETAAFLENELGKPPHWRRAGRVFVVDVTPRQLAAIARSPLVRNIWPNAEWRAL